MKRITCLLLLSLNFFCVLQATDIGSTSQTNAIKVKTQIHVFNNSQLGDINIFLGSNSEGIEVYVPIDYLSSSIHEISSAAILTILPRLDFILLLASKDLSGEKSVYCKGVMFPPNFRVLPEGLTLSVQDPDDDRVRVRTLLHQQSVTAAFGSYVLRDVDLPTMLTEAVRTGAEGLKAPFCKIYRYRSAQDDLIREAGFGWHAGMNEHIVLRADASSPEGRAFVTREPVICNAVFESVRSNRRELHIARPAVSTVAVIINSADGKPYGVLGASNGVGRAYDQNDVGFLSGIANILAGAIVSSERMKILHQMIERLQCSMGDSSQLSERAQVSVDMPRPLSAAGNKVVDLEAGQSDARCGGAAWPNDEQRSELEGPGCGG